MVQSRIYPIADKALDGGLEALLRTRRASGASCESIARELHDDGISVTGETIRTWCRELGIATERAS